MWAERTARQSGASKIAPAEATPVVLVLPARIPGDGLDDERRGDGVDVLAGGHGTPSRGSGADDDAMVI
jgi:hypothetical protein